MDAIAVASSANSTIALGADGNVYGWGSEAGGALGNGETGGVASSPQKAALPNGVTATAIAADVQGGFAIGSDGNLYAWGTNGNGELGLGRTAGIVNPLADSPAQSSENVSPAVPYSTVPVVVSFPAGVTVRSIAAGQYFALAIGSDGVVYGWGDDADGQLGNGSHSPVVATPTGVQLPTGISATQVVASEFAAYALGSDGNVYAWGSNGYGALGIGTSGESVQRSDTPIEVDLPSQVTATAISADSTGGLAIGSDGNAYAWGYNSGALGDGTATSADQPTRVSLPSGITASAISGNGYGALVIGSDHVIYSWGVSVGPDGRPVLTPTPVTAPDGLVPVGIAGGHGGAYGIFAPPTTTTSLPGNSGVPPPAATGSTGPSGSLSGNTGVNP